MIVISKSLGNKVGTPARGQRSQRLIGVPVCTTLVSQGIVAIITALIMGKGGQTAEATETQLQIGSLSELSMGRHPGIGSEGQWFRSLLQRDDVNHTADGITAIERRGRSIENLNTPHVGHVDAVEIDIARDVADEPFAIKQNQRIFVAQSIEPQIGTRGIG